MAQSGKATSGGRVGFTLPIPSLPGVHVVVDLLCTGGLGTGGVCETPSSASTFTLPLPSGSGTGREDRPRPIPREKRFFSPSSSTYGPRGPRPFGRGSPLTGYQPSKLFSFFSMAASSDGVASREPLLPAGGGGADRGAPSTARNLHGELAAAAPEGAMTSDSPIPPPRRKRRGPSSGGPSAHRTPPAVGRPSRDPWFWIHRGPS